MKYAVKLYTDYDSLPDEVKEIEENPYCKRDNYNYLVIYYDNGKFNVYRDGGEPEDQNFCRDWNWVEQELRRAHTEGWLAKEQSNER